MSEANRAEHAVVIVLLLLLLILLLLLLLFMTFLKEFMTFKKCLDNIPFRRLLGINNNSNSNNHNKLAE